MNWCILIPLLVGLICALLGYLLGRLTGAGKINAADIEKLEADLKACKASKMNLESDLSLSKSSVLDLEENLKTVKAENLSLAASLTAPAVALIPFDADAAKAVFGKKIKQDDLTVVEGIGPKIQGLFHNHDVKTWKALSECSVEKCQEVLTSGGDRFKMHKPGTWPKQAKLAYEGKWQELLDWQDQLDGGK
ncbi:hypothetical protein [Neotamlana laminarinivorans]|uniref:LSU ribosomal protein L21p n=1 Tax=Neotamlana laminarinivorans TaxID=2883124 RepID=A0A9X1I0S7_9FLAO|nr:hypothetical protein [Tamlana laminarinivorans]MCB4798157.1 hypothetical protein [Tamlana laminarinivorans]